MCYLGLVVLESSTHRGPDKGAGPGPRKTFRIRGEPEKNERGQEQHFEELSCLIVVTIGY